MSDCKRWTRVTWSLTVMGLLAAGITLHASGCGRSFEDFRHDKGECPAQADDGNPCTEDSCENNVIANKTLPDGTACAIGPNAGTCQGGQCDLPCKSTSSCACATADDCPTPTECLQWTCDNATCKKDPQTMHVPTGQTASDCKQKVCTADGVAADQPDPMDKPADTACTTGACGGALGDSPEQMNKSEGATCAGGVCDGMGACVACLKDADCDKGKGEYCVNKSCVSCSDGKQNGDETGMDCGGIHCNGEKCNGDSCQNAVDCKSGFCTDEVCCNSNCTEECKSCNVMGSVGTCANVPEFGSDPKYTDPDTGAPVTCLTMKQNACNGSGVCLKLAGAKCVMPAECLGGKCEVVPNGSTICKGKLGEPCTTDIQCASGSCRGGTCT